MIKFTPLAGLLLSTAMTFAPAIAAPVEPKPASDASPILVVDTPSFLEIATGSNQFEIDSSKLAKEKSDNADIDMLADMIVADHTKAGEKLNALLETEGKPAVEPMLAPKQETMLEQLQAASGEAFDTLYLDIQAQAHMEAVGLFRTYAGSGDDQTLVGFAKETLPNLETHLAHVKEIIAKQ